MKSSTKNSSPSMGIDSIHKTINALHAQYRAAKDNLGQTTESLRIAQENLTAALRARDIVQETAQKIQQTAHNCIASIVSRCLEAVFEDPYEFQIRFEKKRGKTEAVIAFIRDGEDIDPLTASGGGVIDVASFALRVAAIVMHMPQLRRLIVLDEPFKFVSADLRLKVKTMIELLSNELDIQFIIVTHMPEITCGEVVEL
jgi:ABC-type sugar transport system ATPase subunit